MVTVFLTTFPGVVRENVLLVTLLVDITIIFHFLNSEYAWLKHSEIDEMI